MSAASSGTCVVVASSAAAPPGSVMRTAIALLAIRELREDEALAGCGGTFCCLPLPLGEPPGEGRVFDAALLGEGGCSHAARVVARQDFVFELLGVVRPPDAVAFDDGGDGIVVRRCHSFACYGIYPLRSARGARLTAYKERMPSEHSENILYCLSHSSTNFSKKTELIPTKFESYCVGLTSWFTRASIWGRLTRMSHNIFH